MIMENRDYFTDDVLNYITKRIYNIRKLAYSKNPLDDCHGSELYNQEPKIVNKLNGECLIAVVHRIFKKVSEKDYELDKDAAIPFIYLQTKNDNGFYFSYTADIDKCDIEKADLMQGGDK